MQIEQGRENQQENLKNDQESTKVYAYVGLDGKIYNCFGERLKCPCGSGKDAYGMIVGRCSLYAMCDDCNRTGIKPLESLAISN
jgi:hypothetical protein